MHEIPYNLFTQPHRAPSAFWRWSGTFAWNKRRRPIVWMHAFGVKFNEISCKINHVCLLCKWRSGEKCFCVVSEQARVLSGFGAKKNSNFGYTGAICTTRICCVICRLATLPQLQYIFKREFVVVAVIYNRKCDFDWYNYVHWHIFTQIINLIYFADTSHNMAEHEMLGSAMSTLFCFICHRDSDVNDEHCNFVDLFHSQVSWKSFASTYSLIK